MVICVFYLCKHQCFDSILQRGCSVFWSRAPQGKRGWNFHFILPSKDLSRWLLVSVLTYVLFIFKGHLIFNVCVKTDEWENFQKRTADSPDQTEEIRKWVSYRGQTLSRTGFVIISTCLRRNVTIWDALHLLGSNQIILARKETGQSDWNLLKGYF